MSDKTVTFRFDSIYVIESLKDDDERRTGATLYNEVLKEHEARFTVKFIQLEKRVQFLSTLQTIGDECEKRGNGSPILQIDAHGEKPKVIDGKEVCRGIELTNGDVVTWGDLVDPLTRINKISRMNLLVVLATCHGQHLFSTLIPGRPSPAWAIVTPEDEIFDEEVEDGYREFYKELLTNGAQAGWERLQDWAPVFRCTAEEAFREFYRAVVDNIPMPYAYFLRQPWMFNVLKDQFFMLDTFPEDAERFTIAFDDVMGGE